MRILLIRLSSFGDILFATPAIEKLAQQAPHARIDVATYAHFGAALEHHPLIDRLLLVPKKQISANLHRWRPDAAGLELARFIKKLRAERYDLIVDLHNVFDSAVVALLARGGRRIGNQRQKLSRWFDHRCDFDDKNETAQEHAAASNLRYLVEAGVLPADTLATAPQLSFHAPQAAGRHVDRFLLEHNLENGGAVGLNPGGSYEYKRWAPECFAEVGDYLHERCGQPILLFGGPSEQGAVDRVAKAMTAPSINTVKLPLYEAFELIGRLRLLVTNDSAPLHVAAAAGTPAVGLYGPANFRKFYPLSDAIRPVLVDVPCRPCKPAVGRACPHRDCFTKLSVQQVLRACDELLAETHRRAS